MSCILTIRVIIELHLSTWCLTLYRWRLHYTPARQRYLPKERCEPNQDNIIKRVTEMDILKNETVVTPKWLDQVLSIPILGNDVFPVEFTMLKLSDYSINSWDFAVIEIKTALRLQRSINTTYSWRVFFKSF